VVYPEHQENAVRVDCPDIQDPRESPVNAEDPVQVFLEGREKMVYQALTVFPVEKVNPAYREDEVYPETLCWVCKDHPVSVEGKEIKVSMDATVSLVILDYRV